jgi:cell division protein FtsI/penicillin-binding protein 2
VAYSAIANQGKLMKPHIVSEIRYENDRVEKTEAKILDQVISPRAAKLLSGMLVSVLDNGQGKIARVSGYYVAGKTGTAQIAGKGGYTTDTNHTFVGYAPADDPKFVMVVKYEKPHRAWADSTTAPTFADIAKFVLDYYNIPKER